MKAAREAVARARTEAAAQAVGPAPTVRTAVEAYIKERDDRERRRTGRDVRSDASIKLRRYVLGQEKRGKQKAIEAAPLAGEHLHTLKEDDLLTWREGLPEELKVTTKQRFVNDLKAALNAAWSRLSADRKKLNPTFLAIVKAGFKAERIDDDDEASVARDNQILTDEQMGLILQAAREIDQEQGFDGDLYRIVICLAATGARYAQGRRMRVGDVQVSERRLMVPAWQRRLRPGPGGGRRDGSAIACDRRTAERCSAIRAVDPRTGAGRHRLEKVPTRRVETGRACTSLEGHSRTRRDAGGRQAVAKDA
jgi:hypothetical protein